MSAVKPPPGDELIRPQTLFMMGDKGAIVTIPPNYSTNDWTGALVAFEQVCRGRRRPVEGDLTHVYTLHPDQKINGVHYSWGLANERGGWFIVHRFPEHNVGATDVCIHDLRMSRDVVSMKVARVKEWVDFTPPPPETSKPKTSTP